MHCTDCTYERKQRILQLLEEQTQEGKIAQPAIVFNGVKAGRVWVWIWVWIWIRVL